MRRLPFALALIPIAALIAACAAPAAPGWTYAPAPSVTPAPSGEASGSPAASASTEPTARPTATPEESETPEPSESAGASAGASQDNGLVITAPVGAATNGFEPDKLEAEAGLPFTITFDNQDTGVPHNFVLKNPDGTPIDIGDTAFFNGPGERTYDVPELDAGVYPFDCEVHPNTMKGELEVR